MDRLSRLIRSPWFGAAALCALVLLAYYNVLHGDFLYDDEFLIQRNRFLQSWSNIADILTSSSTGGAGQIDSFYRPMQGLLYLFVYQWIGPETWGFHALNVLVHMCNAVLVFKLGRRLRLNSLGSWLAAAVWAVHPVHTEAVSYISATADSLYTLACLTGVYVILPDFTARKIFSACAILVLGLISKESAIVLAALAPVVFFYASEERLQWKAYLRFWPLWTVALFYLIARKTLLNFNDSFAFYKTANLYTEHISIRIYTFLATIPSYISVFFWPVHLHMDRSFSIFTELWYGPSLLGGVILTVALAVVIYSREKRLLPAAFAVLWFLAAHAPHMGVLLPVNSLFLEHWLYLPSIGALLMGFNWLAGVTIPRGWSAGLTVAVLALVGTEVYATHEQNLVWQNPIVFYRNILAFEPVGSARVHNNLAMALSGPAHAEAIEHYKKAIAIDDHYPQTHHNLAMLLLLDGNTDEAIREFKRAIELNAGFFYSYKMLSEIYRRSGDQAQAEFYDKQFELMKNKFGQ